MTALCATHADSLGFDSFIYALRIPTSFAGARMVVVKGYPDAWLDHYFASAFYETDPVIAACKQRVTPFTWQDVVAQGAVTVGARRVMDEATDFGLRTGISMPVHGPHGELGILSLASNDAGRAAHETAVRALAHVQLLAGHLHEAVHRVTGRDDAQPTRALSPRELECLRWAADGKTSWEIATVLDMTERTVNFHLANAAVKLDVSNRQHAIAKAIVLGLLSPLPF